MGQREVLTVHAFFRPVMLEKRMKEEDISIGKTDLIYNSMGLCGNLTGISIHSLKCLQFVHENAPGWIIVVGGSRWYN